MDEPRTDPFADGRPLPAVVDAPQARPLERPPAALPAPIVAAAGGFLAGVVTYVFARVIRRGLRLRPSARRSRALEISSTRSFLVDVHVLKR